MSVRNALTAVALLVTATPLAAQGTDRVYVTRPDVPARGFSVMTGRMASRRGVIGVGVDLRPSANDSVGATLTTVTPGGAAAGAGIVGGDIITKFNGTALVDRGRRSTDDSGDDDQSQPGLRLLELASRMSPGDTVTVEWKHERSRKTARLVTQPAATMVYSTNDDGPDVRVFGDEGPGRFKFNFQDGAGPAVELENRLRTLNGELALTMPGRDGARMFMRMDGPLGGVQFAPLNADLGRYFGATDGILVLETPDSSAHVDLKGGDVILAVGDRKPANVEHLLRILGSYQDSEVVHFDVMRDHRRITIDAKAEDLQPEQRWKVLGDHMPDLMPSEAPPREGSPRTTEPRRSRRPGA
jgi:hypothetical protein